MLMLVWAAPSAAQQTRAELTDAKETSTYADVMSFLDSLQRLTPDIRRWTMAVSPEGRAVPVVLAARPMVDSPEEAHRSGKPILYIQGNIHAGEVEGKEAAQMILRDLTIGPLRSLLDSVIVLMVPVYNADGNEDFKPGSENRPGQNGPAIVGRRSNGQGYDLNRDYVKLEAPETRGALDLILEWGPDFFVDLHTTNGSYHGYDLTWSPGLNPNSTPANAWGSEVFLPEIKERMEIRHDQETFPYGNFRNQHPDSLDQGWYTYEPGPRFGTNAMGMRGRIAILSEAYSNDPFGERISATYNFIREILSLAAEKRGRVKELVRASFNARPDSVTVRTDYGEPVMRDVIAEITRPDNDGHGGYSRRIRTGEYRTIRMPVYGSFTATRREAMPAAYLLPPALKDIVELLLLQGINVERITQPWHAQLEAFVIDSMNAARRPFQGHRMVSVEGQWSDFAGEGGPGWFLVPTDQRLGVFAAWLLEPASEDGLVTWGFFDRSLGPGERYPVLRSRAPLLLTSRQVAPEL